MFGKKKSVSPVRPREKVKFSVRIKSILLSAHGFPIILTIGMMAVLFVLFRMKSVELDYKFVETKKQIEKSLLTQKDLKAKQAKFLSVKNLRELAKKHNFSQPKENQIIVIP